MTIYSRIMAVRMAKATVSFRNDANGSNYSRMDHCRPGHLGALPDREYKHRPAGGTDELQY
jgi:hypothetical protein